MLVDEFLERTAARDPDKTAVVAGNPVIQDWLLGVVSGS